MTRRRKKAGPASVVVTDPELIEALTLYREADDGTKAAMLRMAERMMVEKMPFEIAVELFKLEIAGADPDTIAARRRRRLRIVTNGHGDLNSDIVD